MYFLPTFLAHYRNLGVERFVFLDDRSNDGTQQYLFAQPDVVIVQSNHTYGEPARERDGCPESTTTRSRRYSVLWRSLLHDMFAEGKWALQVDLDEFVCVPDGTTIREFVSTLDELDLRAVWGVMLDIYPRDIASLNELSGARLHSMSGDWYFDAERHLRLRKHRGPSVVYAGARARLYETYGVDRLYSQLKVSTKHIRHPWPSRIWNREPNFKQYNSLQKPVLIKWGPDCQYHSSHSINLNGSSQYLLPIQHFRFTGALHERIRTGLEEGGYYNQSADHQLLKELLGVMSRRAGSFLYSNSRQIGGFDGFRRSGNAHVGSLLRGSLSNCR